MANRWTEIEFVPGGNAVSKGTANLESGLQAELRSSVHARASKLHELAHQRRTQRKISYGEALGQVMKENPDLLGAAAENPIEATRLNILTDRLASAELSKIAMQRQMEKGLSFSEALGQVAQKNPDLQAAKLHDLADKRMVEKDVCFGEAIGQVLKENPDIFGTGRRWAFLASVELNNLARQRQKEKSLSFSEALHQVVEESPTLANTNSLPPEAHYFSEGLLINARPEMMSGVALTKLAKDRQRERSISFAEALTEVAKEHPELT
jgi:predicted transcriptional regulator